MPNRDGHRNSSGNACHCGTRNRGPRQAGRTGLEARRAAEALDVYRWFRSLLDVSTYLVQSIEPAEALAIGSTEHVRMPRLPLSGARRTQVERIVRDAIATRPGLAAAGWRLPRAGSMKAAPLVPPYAAGRVASRNAMTGGVARRGLTAEPSVPLPFRAARFW